MNLLRERDFRLFWSGQTISLVGDQITLLALPLTAVLLLDANAAQMGYLGAATLMPHLLFSLPAGVWLERVAGRRRIMIGADIGRALLLASVPLAHGFDAVTFGQLYAVAFATGCLAVLFDISYSTLFVAVVERERYLEANSLLNGSRSLSYVAGPSLGGLLVQALGAAFALLADALSFLASALLLGSMHASEPPLEPQAANRREQVAQGLRFIFGNTFFRPALAATATLNFFNLAFGALFILYATRELGVRPGTLGLVLGAGAVGGVLGAFVAGRLGRRIGLGPAFIVGQILFPLPLLLVPLASGSKPVILAMLFAAEFFSGLGVMILDINAGSMMTALTGGALGATLGLRPALWITTVGALAGVLWLLPSPVPGMRDLPEEAV
jgi:MFS family permease